MDFILNRKLKLGISACQFGANFRYNGKGFNVTSYINRDKNDFSWTPICPEVMSGMGVPRPSIRLVKGNGFDFWNGEGGIKNREGEDKKLQMKNASLACLKTIEDAGIDAFIFMEGSPSCGINRTTLKNRRLGKPPGVFGALLLNHNIFLINSIDLQSPIKWWDWKRRLVSFVWLKEKEINSLEDLTSIWEMLKYIIYEIDEENALSIEIAIKTSKIHSYKYIKDSLLNILRKPSSVEKIKENLWNSYLDIKDKNISNNQVIYEPHVLRNMTHLKNELTFLEIQSKKNNLFFKSFPILYKPGR